MIWPPSEYDVVNRSSARPRAVRRLQVSLSISISESSRGHKTQTMSENGTTTKDWKALAIEKYGQAIVDATIHHYIGDYREMLEDDNIRGAVPTLRLNGACPWLPNSPKYFFLCLLVELRYHRDSNELRLYLDARGERDLRNPEESTVERRPFSCNPQQSDESDAVGEISSDQMITGDFVSEVSMPGHHKGYLSFDAGQFSTPGKYFFNFCDIRRNAYFRRMKMALEARGLPSWLMIPIKDYPSVMILEVKEGGLEQAFANASFEGKVQYALPTSPFQDETEEDEMRRFVPHLNEELLRRHEVNERKKKWWVGPNDNVEAVPQRFIFGDLSGRMVTGTFRQRDE